MARLLGRRVWRGQTVEDAPLPRKHWRVREKREWRQEIPPAPDPPTDD